MQALIGQGAAVLCAVALKRSGADDPLLWRALRVGEFDQPAPAGAIGQPGAGRHCQRPANQHRQAGPTLVVEAVKPHPPRVQAEAFGLVVLVVVVGIVGRRGSIATTAGGFGQLAAGSRWVARWAAGGPRVAARCCAAGRRGCCAGWWCCSTRGRISVRAARGGPRWARCRGCRGRWHCRRLCGLHRGLDRRFDSITHQRQAGMLGRIVPVRPAIGQVARRGPHGHTAHRKGRLVGCLAPRVAACGGLGGKVVVGQKNQQRGRVQAPQLTGHGRQVAGIEGHRHGPAGGLKHTCTGGEAFADQQHIGAGRLADQVEKTGLAGALASGIKLVGGGLARGAVAHLVGQDVLHVPHVAGRVAHRHPQHAAGRKAGAVRAAQALSIQVRRGASFSSGGPKLDSMGGPFKLQGLLPLAVKLCGFVAGIGCSGQVGAARAGCRRLHCLGPPAGRFGHVNQGGNGHPAAGLDAAPGAAHVGGAVVLATGRPVIEQVEAGIPKLGLHGHHCGGPIIAGHVGRHAPQHRADGFG